MKQTIFAVFLTIILLTFTGCPVGIGYPPGNPGTEEIEKKLMGTWSANNDNAISKVEIKKKDKNSYAIEVLEKGEMYTLETTYFTGWVTTISGKKFLYAKPDGENNYYTYCYALTSSGFKTWGVALKVGGVDAVTSTEAFREEIKASMKFNDFLSEETEWK